MELPACRNARRSIAASCCGGAVETAWRRYRGRPIHLGQHGLSKGSHAEAGRHDGVCARLRGTDGHLARGSRPLPHAIFPHRGAEPRAVGTGGAGRDHDHGRCLRCGLGASPVARRALHGVRRCLDNVSADRRPDRSRQRGFCGDREGLDPRIAADQSPGAGAGRGPGVGIPLRHHRDVRCHDVRRCARSAGKAPLEQRAADARHRNADRRCRDRGAGPERQDWGDLAPRPQDHGRLSRPRSRGVEHRPRWLAPYGRSRLFRCGGVPACEDPGAAPGRDAASRSAEAGKTGEPGAGEDRGGGARGAPVASARRSGARLRHRENGDPGGRRSEGPP